MKEERALGEIIAELDALIYANEDQKAEALLLESIAEYTEAKPNDLAGQSVLLNELGGFYRSRGVFDKGEQAFLRAKTLLEQFRGITYMVEGPPSCGCCSCSAPLYEDPGSEGGDRSQRHAEIVYGNDSMTVNYATTLNNLAGLYRLSGETQKAIEVFDMAINVYENCEESVAPDVFASVYNNKGLVYLDLRNVNEANAMFLKAKEILKQAGEENHVFAWGTTISNLGFAALMDQNYSEAVTSFRNARELFEKIENLEMVQNCNEILSRLEAVL